MWGVLERSESVIRHLVLILFVVLALPLVAHGDDYVIKVDGKEVRPLRLLPMATRGLVPGEVVKIRSHWLTLGPPGTYDLHATTSGLARTFEDGHSEVIAVTIGRDLLEPESSINNPLAAMSPEERKCVREVKLRAVDDAVYASLEDLDFSRAAITWMEVFWSGPAEALPRLPTGTQHLVIILHYNLRFGMSEVRDISAIEKLANLRTLFAQAPNSDFDLGWIRKNRHLTHLSLSGQRIRSPETLLQFPELERLDLDRAAIQDLSLLSKLTRLESLHANFSRAARLPAGAMPSLKELQVAGAELSDAAVERFRKANPGCRIDHRWNRIFRERTSEATRIRLLKKDQVVATIDSAEEVREFLNLVSFHDSRCIDVADSYLGHEVQLELRNGEDLLGRLEIGIPELGNRQRPLVVSWPDEFPGDGTLTEESATLVARWIGERGVPELPRALSVCRRKCAGELRRWRSYERYLPEFTYRWFHCGVAPGEVPGEFAHAFPDPYRRARVYLLLLGAEESSWNLAVGLDHDLVNDLLPMVKKHALSRVATRITMNQAEANGLGRWLFGEGHLDSLDRAALRKILPEVARRALAHPRRINRQRTMDALATLGDKVARGLLEEVAAGSIEIRTLPEEARVEATDSVAEWQESMPAERDVSDQVYAREKLTGR
jgi:Leucine-rich repeat (LRR) protein